MAACAACGRELPDGARFCPSCGAGGWDTISALRQRVEEAVAANLETPCVRNPRSLLVCAIAEAYRGNADESHRLEERAEALGYEGYERSLNGPRLRLALLRGDLDGVRALVDRTSLGRVDWFAFSASIAALDAFAALGERARLNDLAEQLLGHGKYFEPFAFRALGVARDDERLIRQALERFEALRFDWHAGQTRALLP